MLFEVPLYIWHMQIHLKSLAQNHPPNIVRFPIKSTYNKSTSSMNFSQPTFLEVSIIYLFCVALQSPNKKNI